MLGEVINCGFPFNAKAARFVQEKSINHREHRGHRDFSIFFLSDLRDLSGKKPLRKTLLEITHKKRCVIV